MGQAQRRNLRSAADLIDEAARVHDDAVKLTNECIVASNKATADVAGFGSEVTALRGSIATLRAEYDRRLQAQGAMITTCEQFQKDQGAMIMALKAELLLAQETARDHERGCLTRHRVLSEAQHRTERLRQQFEWLTFWERLRWLVTGNPFGSAGMVSEATSEQGKRNPNETLPPNILARTQL